MLNRVIKLLVLTILLIGIGGGWLAYDIDRYANSPIIILAEKAYVIKPGTSVKALAKDLASQGVLEKPLYFEWYARATQMALKIQAGEYLLKPGTTPKQLLTIFNQGDVTQYALTVVEGWTFKQMLQAIERESNIKSTLKGLSREKIMERLGMPGKHPEGLFYPDTYYFPLGDTDVNFLKRAYQRMDEVLKKAWQQRDVGLPYKTAYDALIMASIVEKETAAPNERNAIAGVFVRRLQKRMRLQTDPTVIYGLGDAYDGNIRRRDLKNPHPYNTYVHRGLPPTPIALPGKDAIYAALHPKPGKDLYFVARGDGSHYFSATLEEHNRAVAKYQLKRRRR